MWWNKQSQSTAPSASSGRIMETSSGPKVPANSGSPTRTTAHANSWLSPTMRVKGEISGNEDLLVDGEVEGPISLGEHRLTVGHNGQVSGGLAAREIIIYGKVVEGPISLGEHRLTVGHNGQVSGGLAAREIIIYGKVEGNLSAVSESIEIKKDASVIGDVNTRRIVIEGFKGSIEIKESSKQLDANLDNSIARALSKSASA